jgi:hypothetical protein
MTTTHRSGGNSLIRDDWLINRATGRYDRPELRATDVPFQKIWKEIEMYGTARRNPPAFDPRARDKWADYRLANSREDATLADTRLSRFERALLAFDQLLRRMAKSSQNAAR